MPLPYHEYRCQTCKKLLFKGVLVESEIEIKCRSCHQMNVIAASDMNEYLCGIKNCPGRIPLIHKQKE
ncbi:Com family DNA-binding transcriptional regulator [Candidatus Uhrbacteria bacterium]|nr:Com family DNA-binding transcriptional regulator [Candidatus Uhrbacteria bacterium]